MDIKLEGPMVKWFAATSASQQEDLLQEVDSLLDHLNERYPGEILSQYFVVAAIQKFYEAYAVQMAALMEHKGTKQ